MKRGDQLVVAVEGMADEGKGVTRVDGCVVFVAGGVPGDELRIEITRVRRNYADAAIAAVLVPSPRRVAPRCRYVGQCGGCTWQHLDYTAQLEYKHQKVVDALERVGGFRGIQVPPVLAAESPYYYRNKMEFSFGERWLSQEEMAAEPRDRFALGLHLPLRYDRVLDVHECWLQSETSQRIVNTARRFCRERGLSIYSSRTHEGYLRNLVIRESKRTQEVMVNLVTSDDRPEVMRAFCDSLLSAVPAVTTLCNNITQRKSLVAVGDAETVYYGPGFITERLGTKRFRISANSFFQTNTLQAERLYETARKLARLSPSDIVFDLYSGTGTIALSIADDVAKVVGVESVPAAVDDAVRNCALNGVRNCEFVLGDLKLKLTRDRAWLERHHQPTAVVLDPPRAGAHEDVLHQLLHLCPRRIVYVSCNPATQARDLAILCKSGLYAVGEVQPVDMFPQTSHIENVVTLGRR